jgi:hypothetical protein
MNIKNLYLYSDDTWSWSSVKIEVKWTDLWNKEWTIKLRYVFLSSKHVIDSIFLELLLVTLNLRRLGLMRMIGIKGFLLYFHNLITYFFSIDKLCCGLRILLYDFGKDIFDL